MEGLGWKLIRVIGVVAIIGLVTGGIYLAFRAGYTSKQSLVEAVATSVPTVQPDVVILMTRVEHSGELTSPVIHPGETYWIYLAAAQETSELYLLLAVVQKDVEGSFKAEDVQSYLVNLNLSGATFGIKDETPYVGRVFIYSPNKDCLVELGHSAHKVVSPECVIQ